MRPADLDQLARGAGDVTTALLVLLARPGVVRRLAEAIPTIPGLDPVQRDALARVARGLASPSSLDEDAARRALLDAVAEYRQRSEAAIQSRLQLHTSVSAWLDGECVVGPDAAVSTQAAWQRYERWCETAGYVGYTSKEFAKSLRAMGFEQVATVCGHEWAGFEPRAPECGAAPQPTQEGSVLRWVHEDCRREDGSTLETTDAYAAYRHWCRRTGIAPFVAATFRRYMRALGFATAEHPSQYGRHAWVGLELRDDFDCEVAS